MTLSPFGLICTLWGKLLPKNNLLKFALFGALLVSPVVKAMAKLARRDSLDSKTHKATDEDVRRVILAYADGLITLEELDTWLTQATWDNHESPPLAHNAELLISEAWRGDRVDLAGDLRRLAAGRPVPA